MWTHVVLTYDAGLSSDPRKLLYVDGALAASLNANGALISTTDDLLIGKRQNARFFEGNLDELRISNSARSSNYVCTSYTNQANPTSNISVCDPTGGSTWTGNASTDWNNPSNWSNCEVPAASADVVIADVSGGSGNNPTLDQSRSYASLTIDAGGSLTLGSNTLTLTGNLTNNGTLTTTGSTVSLEGTAAQTISGSSATTFNNLTLNNTSVTGITLSQDINIGGFLNLTDGLLNTSSSDILTINSGGGTSGGSNDSHVNGPVQKIGDTSFLFPTGKGGFWAPIEISGVSVSDTFTAEYFNTSFSNTTSEGAGLNNISALEYWELDRTGSASANVTLHWKDDTRSEINNPRDLVVGLFNTSSMAWNSAGQTAVSGTTVGSVTSASTSTFGTFTFGSGDGSNALPITLLYFSNEVTNEGVVLEWATATEENNAFFTIERGTSAIDMRTMAQIPGAGQSNTVLTYQYLDRQPLPGRYFYRLKQTDFNGLFTYSELITAVVERPATLNLQVVPNPSAGDVTIIVDGLATGNTVITLYNQQGQVVYWAEVAEPDSGRLEHSIAPAQALPAGIYLVKVTAQGQQLTHRLIRY